MAENDSSSVNKDPPVPTETRIKLPMFSGNPRGWKEWWSNFERAVHSNAELGVPEKLQYFCNALLGRAKGLQRKFLQVPENYDSIIQAFQNRFSNPDQLALTYCRDLEKIPAAGGSLSQQQFILDRFLSTFANLRAIGFSSEERINTYSYLVMSKFPTPTLIQAFTEAQFMQLQTLLAKGSNPSTGDLDLALLRLSLPVDTLLEAIRRVLVKYEYVTQTKGQQAQNIILGEVGSNSSGNNDANNVNQKPVKHGIHETQECLLCLRKNHESVDCPVFPSVKVRKKMMRTVGLCLHCLNEGHSSDSCIDRKKICIKCGQGNHHVAVCKK